MACGKTIPEVEQRRGVGVFETPVMVSKTGGGVTKIGTYIYFFGPKLAGRGRLIYVCAGRCVVRIYGGLNKVYISGNLGQHVW